MSSHQEYCLGFAFDENHENVLLIRKNRPAWQAGKLNGIGGKVEIGEKPEDAMVREFLEETGVQTELDHWDFKGKLGGEGYSVLIFKMVSDLVYDAKTMETEEILLKPINLKEFQEIGVHTLGWLVPMLMEEVDKNMEFSVMYE